MSLPLPWVDKIFEKLTLTYGQAFLSRWKDIDINAVKSDWMHELSVFQQSPNRISFALENLPDRPPSVIEFKNLCRHAQMPELPKSPALPEPKADPDRVAAELAKLAPLRMAVSAAVNPREWAHRIMSRHNSGQKISPTVVQMAKTALGDV